MQIRAARKLLDSALLLTRYVEYILHHRPDLMRDLSKEYAYFPIALPAADGGEAKQLLGQIRALPIGENGPFKKAQGRRKRDAKRETILLVYSRLIAERPDLAPISAKTARLWAKEIINYIQILRSRGLRISPEVLEIDPKPTTGKRKRKKLARVKKAFRVKMIRPSQGLTPDIQYITDIELEAGDATRLQERMKKVDATGTIRSDETDALVGSYEKRIRSMLK